MAWIPHDVTPTELSVLRTLWRRGPSTICELTDVLYPEGTHAQYATVQSLLDRLASKSLVEREKRGRVNVFTAILSRSELIARRLRETADHLCEGSWAPLLSHLVRSVDLSEDELTALNKLVDRLDRESANDDGEEA